MYSLIRVWIGLKLARMEIHVRVVVRTTSATDSPSAPSLYWMPKIGIQSTRLDELEARPVRAGSRRAASSETTQVSEREAERDGRASAARAGSPRTSAPSSGRKMMIDRIGMLVTSIVSGPPGAGTSRPSRSARWRCPSA